MTRPSVSKVWTKADGFITQTKHVEKNNKKQDTTEGQWHITLSIIFKKKLPADMQEWLNEWKSHRSDIQLAHTYWTRNLYQEGQLNSRVEMWYRYKMKELLRQ